MVSCAPTLSRASLHLSAVQLAPKKAAGAGKPAAPRKPRTKKAASAAGAAKPRKAKAATKGAATGAKKKKRKATKKAAKPKKRVVTHPARPKHRPPTRPGSTYAIFVKEQAARVIPKGTPIVDANAQITALASQWSTMGPSERAPYQQQYEAERRKYEADKAKYFETVTAEDLAAENAWRRSTNKRRAAKPTKRPRGHLKKLQKPSAVKQPLTPFFAFMADERQRLASSGEGVTAPVVFAKEMGARWRALSESQKAVRRDAGLTELTMQAYKR